MILEAASAFETGAMPSRSGCLSDARALWWSVSIECACVVDVFVSPYWKKPWSSASASGALCSETFTRPGFCRVLTGEGIQNHTRSKGRLGESRSVGTFAPDPLDKETGYFAV
jgi:hypothetical protein